MANESVSVNDLFQSIFPQEPTDTGPTEQEAPAREPARLGGPPTPYDDLIYKLASARGQDPNLIKAQIWAESRFNPHAVSPKNAQGLTQFIPGTYARFGKGDPFNPRNAIEAQLNYNEYLGNMFGGDVPRMLAAYNAGEGNVQKYGGIPPFKETQGYVSSILNKYAEYTGGATPEGAVGRQQQPASPGVYELELPNGGILTVPEGMSQQEAIAEAAKEYPGLEQYLHPQAAATEAKPATSGNVLRDAAGNLIGGAEELGSSLLKGYSETGLPGAEKAEEYSKAMQESAEKRITQVPQEEIDAAYKDSFLSGLATEAKSVGLHDIPHMIGRYGATLIPAGRALTVGKYMLEGLASFGDIQKRAEKEDIDVDTWKAGAGAAVSSLLANAGLPHVVAGGIFNKVLGGASTKTLEKAFEKGGVEEANKLLGSRIIDTISGLATATGAGFGVMAGTEAAQRAALGQPMQTPDELTQELRAAAFMSPMALPGALRAKGERGKYIDYMQEQEALKQKAGEIAAETPTTPGAPPPEMDQEFPNLTKRVADEYRAALKEQEAPAPEVTTTPEPPVGEAAAPKEPVSATYNVDTDVGSFPVEVTRSPDGSVSIDSGEGPFGYSAKSMAGKTDADILAQHFAEAGFKSAAPAGEAPKEAPKTEEVKVEEPAPPPEMQAPPVEEMAAAPVAEPHFAESVLGLKPAKDKRSLYQKLLKQDINTPEGREAITDLLHKTTARIEPEKLATLQRRMEEIDGILPSKLEEQQIYAKTRQSDLVREGARKEYARSAAEDTRIAEREKGYGMDLVTQRLQDVARDFTEKGPDAAKQLLRKTLQGNAQQKRILDYLDRKGKEIRTSGDYGAAAREIVAEIGARSPQGREWLEQQARKFNVAEQQRTPERARQGTARSLGETARQVPEMQGISTEASGERALHEMLPTEGVEDAYSIEKATESYAGRGTQPEILEKGKSAAISSEGVRGRGQKVQVPEEKIDDFIARVAEMQKSKAAKQKVEDEALIKRIEAEEYGGGYEEGEPEELRFAKAAPIENPHTAETLQEEIGKHYGRTAPRVEISTREAEGVDPSVRGFFDPKTGRTVLIADNIGRGEDLPGLMRHEVATHAHRLGKKDVEFQDILRQVEKLKQQGAKDVLDAEAMVPVETRPEHRLEETLAYLVQNRPQLPIVQRFKSWLRRAVNRLTGSTRWLKGEDFAAMADDVLRRIPKEAVTREGERMFAKRKSEEEKILEEGKLTKVAPSSTAEAIDSGVKAVKNIMKTAMDSQMREEVHASAAQKAVAQSAALAKHVSPLDTFSDWWGVRSDILRNQFDSLGHILTNGLRLGAPDISKGGMMKIDENPRLALHNWFARSEKLPVSQRAGFDVLRTLIGEQWEKESADMRKRAQDYTDYAEVLAKSVDKVQGKERDKRRKMAADLKKEARNLRKRSGEAPMEGLEKKVEPKHIKAAHDLLARHPELKDWVDQTHEINRRAVDFLVKTDVLDTETAKTWKSRPYIALFKSLEDLRKEKDENLQLFEGSAKTLGTRKRIKGGTHEVNVPENMLRSWVQLYTTGYKNYVRKRSIQEMRMFGKVERTNAKDPLAVLVKKAGKDEYWRVPDQATFEALKMTPFIHGVMSNMMAAPTGFVRSTLIKHPVFWVRSITREPLTANFTSRTGFVSPHQVIGHLFKSMAGISKPKKTLETYGTSGVLESQLDPAKFSRAITKASGYEKIADYWNKVHSSFDTATRSAVFEAAKKEGAKYGLKDEMLEDFAAMKASEFANFATRGSSQLINEWGRMTPFFKASLNSLDNLYRNATGVHLNYREKQQAREMFRARAAGMAYMTALYTLAMLNDPDYRNAPDSDWTMNYFIPTGRKEGKWLPIASGFEPAVMFKMLPELLVRTYTGNLEPQEAAGIAGDVAQERLLPPMLPLLPALFTRVAFDYDINLGREIESPGAKRLPPELRDYNASVIGKMLAEKFNEGGLGVSPTKLDNLGKGILGGVYDMAITMADMYLAEKDPAQLFDKDIGQKYPLLKAFYTSSQNVQKAPVFYEAANSFQQAVNAINEAGNVGDVDRLNKLMADPELMKKYELATPLRQYRDNINQIRQTIKALRHMEMPAEEREARAKDLTRLRHQYETEAALMAQKALREMK